MIGIDIVDHNDVTLKKRSETNLRFISHPSDSSSKDESIDQDRVWWAYWAAKEAIFKVNRLRKKFDPKGIPVQFNLPLSKNQSSPIRFSSGNLEGEITLSLKSTLAIAKTPEVKRFHTEVFVLGSNNPSLEVRTKCSEYLERFDLEITNHQIPSAIDKNGQLTELSFSHQGTLGAFMVNLTGFSHQ